MACPHPRRPVKARGRCAGCYSAWWRIHRKPLGLKRQLHSGMLPDRILQVLEVDGPLYKSGLVVRLNANEASVHRALFRLRDLGKVASVPTGPVEIHCGGPFLWRTV